MFSKTGAEPRGTNPDNKQDKWDMAAAWLESITDAVGESLDENVKETVIALNVIGLPTSESHDGCIKYDNWPAPWVDVQAPNRPEFRFIGERELVRGIMEEHEITEAQEKAYLDISRDKGILEEIEKARPEFVARGKMSVAEREEWLEGKKKVFLGSKLKEHDIDFEEYKRIREGFNGAKKEIGKAVPMALGDGRLSGEETPEYLSWLAENKKLMARVQELLAEFYLGRFPAIPEAQLDTIENDSGYFAITNRGGGQQLPEGLSNDQIEKLSQRLEKYHEEMREFGRFLHQKFLVE